MKPLFVILIIGLFFVSCKDKVQEKPIYVSLDSLQCESLKMVIINDTSETDWPKAFKGQFWTPTQKQIREIDSFAIIGIRDNKAVNDERLFKVDLNDFYRQYVLYINPEGDSLVFLNAFCEKLKTPDIDKNVMIPFDWQHEILHVDDGGDCFWRIWINFSKKRYTKFMVNGDA